MTLIFWQGIISIHQHSFLEALAQQPGVEKVVLIVENDISSYRKNMGWGIPEFKHVTIIVSPTAQQISDTVIKFKDAIHIMGGIRVGKMLATAMDECMKLKCKMGIMTEPYNNAGTKGLLRTLKYKYYKLRYFKHIHFVLAIGTQGVIQYTHLGYNTERLYPWAYFITVPTQKRTENPTDNVRIMYGGRLEAAKGIYNFVEELTQCDMRNYTLHIYGEGEDAEKLSHLVKLKGRTDNIQFFPFLKYEDLLKVYAAYDWVVLPSAQKDGWGVVVSEGMLNGLKALCSDICGVSRVIQPGKNGLVFNWAEPHNCINTIMHMLLNEGFATPSQIQHWANKSISAEAGAYYFVQIINNVYHHKPKPDMPWNTPCT